MNQKRRVLRFQTEAPLNPRGGRRIRAYIEGEPQITASGVNRAAALYELVEAFPEEFGLTGICTDFPFVVTGITDASGGDISDRVRILCRRRATEKTESTDEGAPLGSGAQGCANS
jgi:hypothetical protein